MDILSEIRRAAIALAVLTCTGACAAEEWVALELYVSGDETDAEVRAWAESAIEDREGVNLRVYDLSADDGGRQRYESVCSYYKLDADEAAPLLYGCGTTIRRPDSESALKSALDQMLTMTVYVRSGCPRCARARQFLEPTMRNYPGFKLVYRDTATDRQATRDMQEVARRYRQSAVVPVFHFCNQVIVGFDRDSTTGRRLESALDHWTYTREDRSAAISEPADEALALVPARSAGGQGVNETEQVAELVLRGPGSPRLSRSHLPVTVMLIALVSLNEPEQADTHGRDPPVTDDTDDNSDEPPPLPLPEPPPLPLPEAPPLPLPDDKSSPADERDVDDTFVPSPIAGDTPDGDLVHIPFYGEVSASELAARYGLPVFTIIIGLIDGFNPCAMWVLLFLLSILVNLKSRSKILAVAGTFVFISGLAYFAFMAAWLTFLSSFQNVRPVEIVLGILALVIGTIHVKDFFAFKKGVSLSIPEAAKPGIAARVRRIVMAENLWGAVAGASVLAVLINVIELLCTAGLPVLYTGVLTRQGIEAVDKYAYLVLYNIAYMFDDGLMVAIVVCTLGKRRLEERGGRWLKLVSGLVVLGLGVILLVNPELLQWDFGTTPTAE